MESKLEIEIKAKCEDPDSVRSFLKQKGAVFEKKITEKDLYFNHPSRDFGSTDEALRIRSVGDISILTYKGAKLSKKSKARVEEEVQVADRKSLEKIISYLGFTLSGSVVKKREYYSINGIDICIDEVKGLGFFVELEVTGSDIDKTEKMLFDLAGNMGLKEFERRSYLELLYFR